MNYSNAIETIKNAAAKNPAVDAVLHVFATRQRARGRLSAVALRRTMTKEGFDFKPGQLAGVLALLADVGFGTLERSARGRVKGIKDVKVTFKSIGMLAGGAKAVQPFQPRRRFVDLAKLDKRIVETAKDLPMVEDPIKAPVVPGGLTVTISMVVGGKEISIPVPSDLTTRELSELVSKLKAVA